MWHAEEASLNQKISELNGQLNNARKNYEDLRDELEESTRKASEMKNEIEIKAGSHDETISNLKREMRKQFESSRDKERIHNSRLKEYELRTASLDEEVRKQIERHSEDARIHRDAELKAHDEKMSLLQSEVSAYEHKIELLESTISPLRSTISEHEDVIAATTAACAEMSEERRLGRTAAQRESVVARRMSRGPV